MVNSPSQLILSPEQKAMRFLQRRHSEPGQAELFATAISRATQHVADDLNEEGAPVVLNAVLNALAGAVAFYVAQAPVEARNGLAERFAAALPGLVIQHAATHQEEQG